MEIRVHRDNTTAEAVADMLRLNLGDVFETRDDIPNDVTFFSLINLNTDFKNWIISLIQMNVFSNTNNKSSFDMREVEQTKVPKEFLNAVFLILTDTTKKDFVQYRLDLLTEASKENPNFVEV